MQVVKRTRELLLSLTKQAEYKFDFDQKLRHAITNKELYLVYQPQVDIQFDKVIGVEALTRWQHLSASEILTKLQQGMQLTN